MFKIDIETILSAVKGNLLVDGAKLPVTGVNTDTRTIRKGDVFFALIGANNNGHDYINQAIDSGASCLIISQADSISPELNVPVILVDDTTIALGDLAKYYRSLFDTIVIGITGSVGKTMTREMTASILQKKYQILKNEMNFNNEIGVPMTLFNLNKDHKFTILEMAMRGTGEIQRLADIADPSIGVITNIGVSHIERLGSREKIASAKSELLSKLPSTGKAILNADDEYFNFLSERTSASVLSFGLTGNADISAVDCHSDEHGFYEFTLNTPIGSTNIKLPIMGFHCIQNALAASAAAYAVGADLLDIAAGLSDFTQPSMRMEFAVTESGYGVLNDCYNASPASMKAAIQTLSSICGYKRRIAVLGDMGELGDYAQQSHNDIGISLMVNKIDMLIAVGDLSKDIVSGAINSGFPAEMIKWCPDSDSAASIVDEMVGAGDIILVKGSRVMKMEKIVRVLSDD